MNEALIKLGLCKFYAQEIGPDDKVNLCPLWVFIKCLHLAYRRCHSNSSYGHGVWVCVIMEGTNLYIGAPCVIWGLSCVIQLFVKNWIGVLQLLKFFEMCKNTSPVVDVQTIFTIVANEAVQDILLKYKVLFQRLFSMSMLRSKTQSYCIKLREVVHLLKVVSCKIL